MERPFEHTVTIYYCLPLFFCALPYIIRSSRYLILSTSWRTHPRLEYMVFLQGI